VISGAISVRRLFAGFSSLSLLGPLRSAIRSGHLRTFSHTAWTGTAEPDASSFENPKGA